MIGTRWKYTAGVLLLGGLLAGCASAPREPAPVVDARPSAPAAAERSASPAPDHRLQRQAVIEALYAQHDDWAGTPYRLGGASRRGIDCSAFVQTTFASHFDRRLPRSTEGQARVGRPVARTELEAGDLVFFRTGKTRHVGIYVESGQFLHASTSQGVMLSELDNPYWAGNWWTARRP
ncbi:cell wall-associated NlpC family hydrolase [Natronocella acetinitrilica]|uniref:Cell wall-associated NlpC family hydrolase n=1 Tax=Natronocella acetinitrilica TaxID=414046 RepID=A0AAE3G1W1_9GAMM|nr:cell wall-associated NlpC family hydrolase [Natronocella acetinitrilica]